MNPATATAELATFAARTRFEDLPADVRGMAQTLLIDSVGCTVAGHLVAKGAIPTALVADWGGSTQASVIGKDLRVPAPAACLANGELMNALDYDAILAPGHVTPYVVPPALAFAEVAGASGKELVTAVAIAHEIGCRVGAALDGMRQWSADGHSAGSPLSPASGYGSTIFGAAAGAGSVLGFEKVAMANLFGIAGYAAPVPGLAKFVTAPHSFHVKYTSAGQLAMNAAIAVQLAQRGYKGDETVLEGEYGFWRMFASRKCDWDFMLGALGSEWRMLRAEIKPFPAFRMSHDALHALRGLLAEHRINPATIVRIKTTADPLCTSECYMNSSLTDHTDAQLSWPHLLAAAAYYPEPTSWQIEALGDARVRDLARRVEIVPIGDPRAVEQRLIAAEPTQRAFPAWAKSTVEVEAGGSVHVAAAPPVTKGHPDNPMTSGEVEQKYLTNVGAVLGSELAGESLSRLKRLDRHRFDQVLQVLRPRPGVPAGLA